MRRKRLPRPTALGWRLGLGAAAVAAALGVAALARAEETEVPRYQPSARGTRPAVVRWRPLLERYDWDVDVALRVISCESEGESDAVNEWSGATGLFQTMPQWRRLASWLTGSADLADPWVNTAVAYYLWADSGGTFRWHWAASRGCWG